MLKNFLITCTLLSVVPLSACGKAATATKPPGATQGPSGMDMPEWALNQPPLCGVGIMKYRGNLGAAKAAAESRARVDISRQLETKVKSMISDYVAEGGSADGDFSEEQVEQTSKSLSKQTINGSVPKKSYVSKGEDPQFFSLVCLEPGALTDAISNMKELGEAQRKALAQRAEKAHKEMEKEMEKYDDF